MSTNAFSRTVEYPDCDGLPMSDNTLQFQWIMTIVGGLRALFRSNPDVFVAGDLLWYPVEGDNTIRSAPDAMVAFGRPKGYRGSYVQFREGGVAPQVVFEVRSPGNRASDIARKYAFYDRFGVEEYYLIDPEGNEVEGWSRVDEALRKIPDIARWTSPRLGIRFDRSGDELQMIGPDGRPFETYEDVAHRAEEERERAEEERERAEEERERADEERGRAEEERERAEEARIRAERLAEKLRALGADPDA